MVGELINTCLAIIGITALGIAMSFAAVLVAHLSNDVSDEEPQGDARTAALVNELHAVLITHKEP